MKDRLSVIQPFFSNYRVDVFEELADDYEIDFIASYDETMGFDLNKNRKIKLIELKHFDIFGWLKYQVGVFNYILNSNSKLYFIAADVRYVSTLVALVLLKLLNKKVILHGQGAFNKRSESRLTRIKFKLLSLFSDIYICYTQFSKDTISNFYPENRLFVANNSIINKHAGHVADPNSNGIFFIGRLRDDSNIRLLIDSVVNCKIDLELHIVGSGYLLQNLSESYASHSNIKFYGELYNNSHIRSIASKCSLGCYPGDAGLSVLHYLSFGLPVICHSSIEKHKGPEPSYIKNHYNGILFERNNVTSLTDVLYEYFTNQSVKEKIISEAYNSFIEITNPPLSKRFRQIFNTLERA